ncbi:eIF2A family protein [Paenibacillus tuaregi]|uniref:hypothetical protein n=1 Tax=Paenibacillus tuaregi TaxID=1816681 RepID=UPI000837B01A|nr:hypothetical protein [Paenibacillus tuaregi]
MKSIYMTIMAVLVVFTVIGCTASGDISETQAEADNMRTLDSGQAAVAPAVDETPAEASKKYSMPEIVPVQVNDDKVSWQAGDVSFTGHLAPSSEDQISGSMEIRDTSITSGGKAFKLELNPLPSSVSSVTLSADHRYLALHYQFKEGYKLIIMDLKKGDYYPVNDYFSRNGRGTVNLIHAYNWSPEGHELALSYGEQNRSSVAVYDTDSRMLLDIATPRVYKNTVAILWGEDGKGFDFVNGDESGNYVLYQYTRKGNLLQEAGPVSASDLERFAEISPAYAK